MLHRRRARRVKRVVRHVVDRAHDPGSIVADVEHVDARGRLLERAEVGTAARERVGQQQPVHAAVEDCDRRAPLPGQQPLERRQHAVERLAERLTAEKPLRLLAHMQRPDEEALELVAFEAVEAAAAPLVELRPPLGLAAGRDDRGRLDRAGQAARHEQIELDALQCAPGRDSLLAPALGQQHRLRVPLSDVRHLCVPQEVEPSPHRA